MSAAQLQDHLNVLRQHVDTSERELNTLIAGRKVSSARLCKSLMVIKSTSHAMRTATTDFTKTLPTKTKVSKPALVKNEEQAPVEVLSPKL